VSGHSLAAPHQVDVLSSSEDDARASNYIARYGPQPQSHVEGVDPEISPKGQFANLVLTRMVCGA